MSQAFRIHPAINFARVGRSEEYYVAPETAAGRKVDPETGLFGGLPIKPGTEDTPIDEGDIRDGQHHLKRQAARFRVFAYPEGEEAYPNGGGVEVKVGDTVDGKVVADIVWTVHVANKKGNFYAIQSPDPDDPSKKTELGLEAYRDGDHPPVRNPDAGAKLDDPERLTKLVTDPGPRAVSSRAGGTAHFDRETTAAWADDKGAIQEIADYPKSFPDDHWSMFDPLGAIDTLGEITVESGTGRLLVLGGFGRCSALLDADGNPPTLLDPIDNDGWFDDTSDGPVDAVVVFDDGTAAPVHGAWVVTTDPGFAPQTRNVVSTWDDVFHAWVEDPGLSLMPELFANGTYAPGFAPSFDEDVMPIFHGAMLQQWNTNLPSKGVRAHHAMAAITPATNPTDIIPDLNQLIRDPNDPADLDKGVKMPLALGDAQKSFLVLTPTQYFFLKQWHEGKATDTTPALGAGEALDRDVLENCLGGRYSPGIDVTFIVRQPDLYQKDWKTSGGGPFRIDGAPLDYGSVSPDRPFLGVGYVPLRSTTPPILPGDLSKFMSLPWHTDYNSCATHEPDPNPRGNNTLYWSWPAQRPVHVYRAQDCVFDAESSTWRLHGQVYSVRGTNGHGTKTPYQQQQGRFQCYFDFVEGWEWEKVGVIIQGLQIADDRGGDYGADKFLEVASLFDSEGDVVQPWPTNSSPGYERPCPCGPEGSPDPCEKG